MIRNIIIGVLTIIVIYFLLKPKEVITETVTKEVKEYVNAEVERVNHNIDKYGFDHAVHSEVAALSKGKELNDSSKVWKDKFLDQIGINEKQAILITRYETTIKGMNLAASKTDTSFNFKDEFADIQYVFPKGDNGSGHFNFTYDAKINYAEYWKKDWFLGKKKHYIDFWLSDTRATINGVKRIKFAPKVDRVQFDVNAAGFYTDKLNVGADAGLTIDRTRISAGYFYDFEDAKWKPVVGMKFKLIEF